MASALDKINQSRVDDAAARAELGFHSFPNHLRRMILHATEINPDGTVRTKPLESYTEIINFPNASYVRDHLHGLLCNAPLNRDV